MPLPDAPDAGFDGAVPGVAVPGGAAPDGAVADVDVDVDVVIAVHDERRPILRAVSSALASAVPIPGTDAIAPRTVVTVVCHNLDPARIARALAGTGGDQVRLRHLADGIRSPAGPFNLGLTTSRAEFVSTVGSDDVLEPGALAAWYTRAVRSRADAVLAPIRTDDGIVATPLPRPSRPPLLDPLRDHLELRTAPLGLLRRAHLEEIGFGYTDGGLGNGEDIEPGLRLWFTPGRLVYPYGAPAYRVTADMGRARQTLVVGPASAELAFLLPLLDQRWLTEASGAVRDAVLVKVLRHQVLSAILRRTEPAAERRWDDADAEVVRRALARVGELAPRGPAGLSLQETRILRAAAEPGPRDRMAALLARRRGGPSLDKVVTARPAALLARQAPLRLAWRGRAVTRAAVLRSPGSPATG